jgi:crotonobetainyl-CoA:carnitine CoA-transferase CaiB-like acyl-CoA transferase
MSRFIFGPFCTQMLGDMGAEIIKVEPLGLGDPSCAAGNVMVNGISASYLARNRNKRSLAMDMRKPEAQEIVFQLALQSDVLVHNFRPGITARMRLDPNRRDIRGSIPTELDSRFPMQWT